MGSVFFFGARRKPIRSRTIINNNIKGDKKDAERVRLKKEQPKK